MKKPREVEEMIKRAIRDELALHPLKSVAQIRGALCRYGYQAVHGPLDWHYISKLVKKVRLENLASLFPKDRAERFAMLKERHRAITEKLIPIVEGEYMATFDKMVYPTHAERIAAANAILKWDLALFCAEEQVQVLEQTEKRQNEPIKLHPIVLDLQPGTQAARYSTLSTLKKEATTVPFPAVAA